MSKFIDKFKVGDIILSRKHRIMIVRSVVKQEQARTGFFGSDGREHYLCDDLSRDNQRWKAYETTYSFSTSYNWRVATDRDIIDYLDSHLFVKVGKVGLQEVVLDKEGIRLGDYVSFNKKEIKELKDILNKYVVD